MAELLSDNASVWYDGRRCGWSVFTAENGHESGHAGTIHQAMDECHRRIQALPKDLQDWRHMMDGRFVAVPKVTTR